MMTKSIAPIALPQAAILVALLFLQTGKAEEKKPAESEEKKAPPSTVKVQRGFQAQVKVQGTFEPREASSISVDTKEWDDLIVAEVAPHGKRVRKGDVILRLETEKIDEQLEELERTYTSEKLGLSLARAELENLEKTTPIELAAARDAAREAAEDLAYYESTRRDFEKERAAFSLDSAKQSLEYQMEELNQLEKMYEADDLTEETEEIILQRARNAVESAEFQVKGAELNKAETLETEIPRSYRNLKTASEKAQLAKDLAEASLPNAQEQKQLAVEKLKEELQKSGDKLRQLRQDREALLVKAPADGFLYYGDPTLDGKAKSGELVKKLVLRGKLTPREPVMTVVGAGPMELSGKLQEKDLAALKTESKGVAIPVSAPLTRLPVTIRSINYAPFPDNTFAVRMEVEGEEDAKLKPGMTAEVTFEIGSDPDALTIPVTALFQKEGKPVVYVVKNDDAKEAREVSLGTTDGQVVVVEEGLEEGEVVSTSRPN